MTANADRELLPISYPGQCCLGGYCIEAIGAHDLEADVAEFVVKKIADRDARIAKEAVAPAECVMTHTEPFDFAQCESHDTTFALGEVCKFNGRTEADVYYDEAKEQRVRAVFAEMRIEELEAELAEALAALSSRRYTDADMREAMGKGWDAAADHADWPALHESNPYTKAVELPATHVANEALTSARDEILSWTLPDINHAADQGYNRAISEVYQELTNRIGGEDAEETRVTDCCGRKLPLTQTLIGDSHYPNLCPACGGADQPHERHVTCFDACGEPIHGTYVRRKR